LIIEAHGSFATQRCIECKQPFPDDEMHEHIKSKTVPKCSNCKGLIKPDIVFFGEALPEKFFNARNAPGEADLIIVMGTSLTVMPFASLPDIVPRSVPRVLINMEQAGSLGSRPDDVLMLGDCDTQVRKLAEACGWLNELESKWAKTSPKDAATIAKDVKEEIKSKDQLLEEDIDKLTEEVDKTLKVADSHIDRVSQEHPTDTPLDEAASQASTTMIAPSVVDGHLIGKQESITKSDQPNLLPKDKSTL
jgi:NAD-dependent histone deacetylase SIR2